ncbi:MAG: hypothetical protein HYX96_06210 [Chloroflexi bacterium]|nr:hypothetical protein [Chloroflexota bacterium]
MKNSARFYVLVLVLWMIAAWNTAFMSIMFWPLLFGYKVLYQEPKIWLARAEFGLIVAALLFLAWFVFHLGRLAGKQSKKEEGVDKRQ